MNNKKLKKLLFDLSVVDSMLNSMKFDSKTVEQHRNLKARRNIIQNEINLYSQDEIENVNKKKIVKKPINIEYERVIKREDNRGLLWAFLMIYIMDSKCKDKAFLMLACDCMFNEEKIEYKEVMKI